MAAFFSFYEGNNYRIHFMCRIGNYFREFSHFPLSKSRSAVISPPGSRDAMIRSVTGEKPKRSATLQKFISSSPGGMGNLPSRLSFGVDYSIKPRFATVIIPSRPQARPLSLSLITEARSPSPPAPIPQRSRTPLRPPRTGYVPIPPSSPS